MFLLYDSMVRSGSCQLNQGLTGANRRREKGTLPKGIASKKKIALFSKKNLGAYTTVVDALNFIDALWPSKFEKKKFRI